MRHLGVIPARGGSKSIPHKNIAACAGRPLLAWTADAALASRKLDRVLVSTDDPDIAAAARDVGLQVPFLRPDDLATDTTPALPVMRHALDFCEQGGEHYDSVVLLQPTSPLREARHIDAAVELFETSGADTVVSVVEVPHRFHPHSVMRDAGGRLEPFIEDRPTVTRRQDLAVVWARNGPAVLVVSTRTLKSGRLYGALTLGYPMGFRESIDIDSLDDLTEAERLLLNARQVSAPLR